MKVKEYVDLVEGLKDIDRHAARIVNRNDFADLHEYVFTGSEVEQILKNVGKALTIIENLEV